MIGDIAKGPRQFSSGAAQILLVDPNASVGNLRAFADAVMPAFAAPDAVAAE